MRDRETLAVPIRHGSCALSVVCIGSLPNISVTPRTSHSQSASDKSFNRAISNKPVRLNEEREDTDGFATIATQKAPDPKGHVSILLAAGMATVVAVLTGKAYTSDDATAWERVMKLSEAEEPNR